ncbi:hypothetical protein T484DRAFT_1623739, partial [Baffinella frigidus]
RNPEPETLNPKPRTRNSEPETLNPKPETRNHPLNRDLVILTPQTLHPQPYTRNPKPSSLGSSSPRCPRSGASHRPCTAPTRDHLATHPTVLIGTGGVCRFIIDAGSSTLGYRSHEAFPNPQPLTL